MHHGKSIKPPLAREWVISTRIGLSFQFLSVNLIDYIAIGSR